MRATSFPLTASTDRYFSISTILTSSPIGKVTCTRSPAATGPTTRYRFSHLLPYFRATGCSWGMFGNLVPEAVRIRANIRQKRLRRHGYLHRSHAEIHP